MSVPTDLPPLPSSIRGDTLLDWLNGLIERVNAIGGVPMAPLPSGALWSQAGPWLDALEDRLVRVERLSPQLADILHAYQADVDATDIAVAALLGDPTSTRAAVEGVAADAVAPIAPDGGARAVGKGELVINVRDYAHLVDAFGTDWSPAFAAARDDIVARGGGTLFVPAGTYLLESPYVHATNVILRGDGSKGTVMRKTNTATQGGINCVVYGLNINTFSIQDIRLEGDRVTGSGASVIGLYLEGANYFSVKDVTARNCDYGFRIVTCWVAKLERLLAQQCHRQGYFASTSSTSLKFDNCTAWACGGGWRLEGCVYTKIDTPACDYNCAGGRPDDPMESVGGSGGNYLAPTHVFQVIGCQGVSIDSPGAENGFSQWLYAEGSEITINSPYVWRFKNYAATSRFIELRGTSTCNVIINTPKFSEITNEVAPSFTIRGVYADDPKRQKVKLSQFVKLSDTYGTYEFTKAAIEYGYRNNLYALDGYSMKVGDSSPFVPQSAAGSTVVVDESGVKRLKFVSTATDAVAWFRAPLPSYATLRVVLAGVFSNAFDSVQMRIVETNGSTTNILKSWTNNGGTVTADDYVSVNSTMAVYLEVRVARAQENLRFDMIRVTEIL